VRRGCSTVSPNPTSMDMYFQGMGWWNKGLTPEYLSKARVFFERALALDPGNVEAMVSVAAIDLAVGATFMTDNGPARLAAAEAVHNQGVFANLKPRHGPFGSRLRPGDSEPSNPRHW
jgi:hypothetical protein